MGYVNDQFMKTITMVSWIILTLIIHSLLKKNKPSSKEKGISQEEIKSRTWKELGRMVLSAVLGYIVNIVIWLFLLVQIG